MGYTTQVKPVIGKPTKANPAGTRRYKGIVRFRAVGQKEQAWTRTWGKKKEAQAWADRERRRLAGALTVAQLLDRFAEHKENMGNRNTSLGSKLKFWRGAIGEHLADEVTQDDIEEELFAHYKDKEASTFNAMLSVISTAFSWGAGRDEPLVSRNPAAAIQTRRISTNTKDLTVRQCLELLTACAVNHWDRLYLLVFMAITSGARRSELLGIAVESIDLRTRRIQVFNRKGDPRFIAIMDEVYPRIADIVQSQGSGLLFCSDDDIHSPKDVQYAWEKARGLAGLDDFTFHELRHTFGTILSGLGLQLNKIMQLMGHRHIESAQRYQHVNEEAELQAMASALSELLQEGAEPQKADVVPFQSELTPEDLGDHYETFFNGLNSAS